MKGAVVEGKQGKARDRYLESQQLLAMIAPNEAEAVQDSAWIESIETTNHQLTVKLEEELKRYKNNLVKESIRV